MGTTHKQRRNTPQRQVILEELNSMKSHPTAAELFAVVRQRLPRISLGTVYRNLEVLHESGQVNKLELAGTETRFDATMDPHLHVRCTECGRIDDIMDPTMMTSQPSELAGYLVRGCRLEYFGVCPGCRKKSRH
jgi:Fur family ferric uptake transcriptional regulator